ncbi:predicted protein [Lichtheimia corymbifera JMRC:FSU:9682]|uniref:Uncharacterized protein n=1 Tax=Lichtheimia corymbifera JMRC:FSU:9682 TaxID=1263082 RepID=A0A068RTR4_9FUNG|nr:predicted protein [Lichtheimia corymbifera JMRC:FSU:9682]
MALARLAFCFNSTAQHHGFSVSSEEQRRVFICIWIRFLWSGSATLGIIVSLGSSPTCTFWSFDALFVNYVGGYSLRIETMGGSFFFVGQLRRRWFLQNCFLFYETTMAITMRYATTSTRTMT